MIFVRHIKTLFCIAWLIVLPLCGAFAQSLEFNQSKYVKYKVKTGDSIKSIFTKLDYSRLYTLDQFSKKLIALNTDIIKSPKYLHTNRVLILPVKPMELKSFDINDYKTESASFAKRNTASQSQTANKSINKVNFSYPCSTQKDSELYNLISNFAQKNNINELNISFKCSDQFFSQKDLNQKIKPWMQSFESENKPLKNSFFFPYLGFGSTNYSEGSFTNSFSNAYLGLKYRQVLRRPTLVFDGEIKYGLLSLNNNIDGSEANLLDIDLRLGHSFNVLSEPWHFTLFGGVYYSQLFVKNDLYGYQGLIFPQLYPELRRIFKSGHSLNLYFKYAPTGKDFLTLSGKDYAISLGARYNFDWNQKDLFLKLDYSDLRFESPDNNTPVQMKQYFLSLGVNFK